MNVKSLMILLSAFLAGSSLARSPEGVLTKSMGFELFKRELNLAGAEIRHFGIRKSGSDGQESTLVANIVLRKKKDDRWVVDELDAAASEFSVIYRVRDDRAKTAFLLVRKSDETLVGFEIFSNGTIKFAETRPFNIEDLRDLEERPGKADKVLNTKEED